MNENTDDLEAGIRNRIVNDFTVVVRTDTGYPNPDRVVQVSKDGTHSWVRINDNPARDGESNGYFNHLAKQLVQQWAEEVFLIKDYLESEI